MGKCKGTTWWGADAQKGTLLTPSPHQSEASDTGDATRGLMDDVDSLEEGMSQMGISPKTPLRFMQSSRLPS